MSKSNDYFVSYGDAASALGVLEDDFLQWMKEDNPETDKDYINRIAIRKSYLEKCAFKNDYLAKLEKSFRAENIELESESENKIRFYQRERLNLINQHTMFIEDLIKWNSKVS